jgi:mannose-6-phosphate isomerase-like protein (cupin superfamily)
VQYCLQASDAAPARPAGEDVGVQRLFDEERGCDTFDQRILRFPPGRAPERLDTQSDEVLYVLEGTGSIEVAGEDHRLEPGMSVFVARGTLWSVEATDELAVLSVVVREPDDATTSHAVVDIGSVATHGATAGRQFSLGATPEVGCASVTQFVGYIPIGRAPDHFHNYDEVVYVLEGEGLLHIDGETAPLAPGSCVHLPARLVHSLENTGSSEMHVLGVFRPAGSPAEAYYPDGTLAVVQES